MPVEQKSSTPLSSAYSLWIWKNWNGGWGQALIVKMNQPSLDGGVEVLDTWFAGKGKTEIDDTTRFSPLPSFRKINKERLTDHASAMKDGYGPQCERSELQRTNGEQYAATPRLWRPINDGCDNATRSSLTENWH